MAREASCGGSKPGRRGRRRVRGGVRLGLLLRLRVRLFGLVGLLFRGVEELKCCRGRRCSTPAARRPRHGGGRSAPAERESSFYAEAIADCLEFIKSRSSNDPPVKDAS